MKILALKTGVVTATNKKTTAATTLMHLLNQPSCLSQRGTTPYGDPTSICSDHPSSGASKPDSLVWVQNPTSHLTPCLLPPPHILISHTPPHSHTLSTLHAHPWSDAPMSRLFHICGLLTSVIQRKGSFFNGICGFLNTCGSCCRSCCCVGQVALPRA